MVKSGLSITVISELTESLTNENDLDSLIEIKKAIDEAIELVQDN